MQSTVYNDTGVRLTITTAKLNGSKVEGESTRDVNSGGNFRFAHNGKFLVKAESTLLPGQDVEFFTNEPFEQASEIHIIAGRRQLEITAYEV
jgi:hypothetical protein